MKPGRSSSTWAAATWSTRRRSWRLLESGRLAAVALDVYDPEPIPAEIPSASETT